MPSPGDVVPYPPYPAAGAGAQGALQYNLESTQLRIEAQLGAEGTAPPALPTAGAGALARLRQILEVLQASTPLTAGQLTAEGLSKEATQGMIHGLLNAALNVALTTRASEVSLLTAITKLTDIYNRLGDINANGATIAIDTDAINLNTDQVESFLQQIRDRLPVAVGQQLSDASLAVVLSTAQEAILASVVSELMNIKAQLPTALYLERLKVSDRMTGEEMLDDQAGAGGVLEFTFTNAPDIAFVFPDLLTCRAAFTVQPTATKGVRCDAGVPTPVILSGQTGLKVFAPVGTTVSVWGFRYT